MSSSDTENELDFASASESEAEEGGSESGSEEHMQPSSAQGGLGQNVRLLGARHAGVDVMEDAAESLISIQMNNLLEDSMVDSVLLTGVLPPLLASLLASTALQGGLKKGVRAPAAVVQPLLKEMGFDPRAKPLAYEPPTSCRVVGPAAVGCLLQATEAEADIAFEMPAAWVHAKDHLNHKFLAKRALYLANLAARLAGATGVTGVEWESGSDPRLPFLKLTLDNHNGHTLPALRVHAVPPRDAFVPGKLAPDRNCVRSVAGGEKKADSEAPRGGLAARAPAALPPTPYYNHAVLSEQFATTAATALTAAAGRTPALPRALSLLLAWARAQALDASEDGLTPAFLAALAQYAAARAAPSATGLDLTRSALVTLASSKKLHGAEGGLAVPAPGSKPAPRPSAWRVLYDVVLLDGSAWVNSGAGVSAGCLAAAAAAARRALRALNAGTPEAFAAAFAVRGDPLTALGDVWLRVDLGPAPTAGARLTDVDAPWWKARQAAVLETARRALGDRARTVRLAGVNVAADPDAPALGPGPRPTAVLAAHLDAARAFRQVDVGPSAEDKAGSREFRDFWGVRAELRRFQDGRIAESVVWAAWDPEGNANAVPLPRHAIPDAMLAYALPRHVPGVRVVGVGAASGGSATTTANGAESPSPPTATFMAPSTCLDAALGCENVQQENDAVRAANDASERLGKQLRGLTTGVLRVVATQTLAAATRGAALRAPRPHPLLRPGGGGREVGGDDALPRCLDTLPVACTLEGSGRWPATPEPYFKAKAAVACQLASLLTASHGLPAQAGSDATVTVAAHGHAFTLHLATGRDEAMLRLALEQQQGARAAGVAAAKNGAEDGDGDDEKDDKPSNVTPASNGAATVIPTELDLPLRTAHQGFITAVAAEHAAFTPAVRLAKRWVHAHLLGNHICEEAVELLMAAAFGPTALTQRPPETRLAGFMGFLTLLTEHPWAVSALEVGVTSSSASVPAVRRTPLVPMHLVGPGDETGQSPWTREGPSALTLRRMVVLAWRARRSLTAALLSDEGTDAVAPRVFARNLHECDAVLSLRPDALPGLEAGALPWEREHVPEMSSSEGKPHARRRPTALRLEPSIGAIPVGHVLTPVLAGEAAMLRTRASRAVLDGIPQDVIARRGAAAVRKELLPGFDPVKCYVSALQRRLSHCAVVLADLSGGCDVVGLKWLRPALASAASSGASAAQDLRSPAHIPEPGERMLGALCDALALGAGMVAGTYTVDVVPVSAATAGTAQNRVAERTDADAAPTPKKKVAGNAVLTPKKKPTLAPMPVTKSSVEKRKKTAVASTGTPSTKTPLKKRRQSAGSAS